MRTYLKTDTLDKPRTQTKGRTKMKERTRLHGSIEFSFEKYTSQYFTCVHFSGQGDFKLTRSMTPINEATQLTPDQHSQQ